MFFRSIFWPKPILIARARFEDNGAGTMASLESDVISKLNNSFLFNLKKPSFQQFSTTDVLNIYQFLFRVYDPSWLLKDDKPQAVILKQSQRWVLLIFDLKYQSYSPFLVQLLAEDGAGTLGVKIRGFSGP